MKNRFDELLPFYVNDTLDASDRAWVDDYLREHPKSAAELQWYRSLQDTMKRDAPAVSAEVGLERVMARIRAERTPTRAPAKPAAQSLGERLRGWLAALAPQPLLRPALAGALAVVVVQGVVIANLATKTDDSEIRAVKPTVVEAGPYLKVNFKSACCWSRSTARWPAAPGSWATGTCAFRRHASPPPPAR
jgi:anti-sigma factor RsiW